jgi:opacity protein-like surface antigen
MSHAESQKADGVVRVVSKHRRTLVLGVILAGLMNAAPASAQLDGIPVYFNPKGGTGFTLAGDYGRGINDDSGKRNAVAGRVVLGVSAFSLGAGVGRVSGETSFQGTAAIRVFGGAFVPVAVSIQAGLGYSQPGDGATETTVYNVPIGIGFGLNIPTPGFLFEPWVAPRFSLSRVEANGQSENQTGFGLSGGVTIGFAMGLALHAALDWADIDTATFTPAQALSTQPMTLGIGVSYTFRLPGLGVPMMPGM